MKVTVEFAKDGLLLVKAGDKEYVALEAAFRQDGPVPMMDLSIPLAEAGEQPEPSERPKSRTLDL